MTLASITLGSLQSHKQDLCQYHAAPLQQGAPCPQGSEATPSHADRCLMRLPCPAWLRLSEHGSVCVWLPCSGADGTAHMHIWVSWFCREGAAARQGGRGLSTRMQAEASLPNGAQAATEQWHLFNTGTAAPQAPAHQGDQGPVSHGTGHVLAAACGVVLDNQVLHCTEAVWASLLT